MTLTRSGNEIAEYFALAMAETDVTELGGAPLRPRYNIAPSQSVPTILRGEDGEPRLEWKTWGLVPSWSKAATIGGRLFNARSETADTKPSFRSAWKRRRCLIAVDGFYEWTPRDRGHQPYHFRSNEGILLALGGLFEQWHGDGGEIVDSCTVLTTEANADLEGIHHRMPVLLGRESFGAWLDPASEPLLLKSLVVPVPSGTLARQAVSRRVNHPRFDDAECLEPDRSGSPDGGDVSKLEERSGSSLAAEQGELFGLDEEES
jgi:putative SOS response-associated peptidase YedK